MSLGSDWRQKWENIVKLRGLGRLSQEKEICLSCKVQPLVYAAQRLVHLLYNMMGMVTILSCLLRH